MHGSGRASLFRQLTSLLERDERPPAERERLARLMTVLARLEPPPDPDRVFPSYAQLRSEFVDSISSADPEVVEERFLELYCHLHMHVAPYTAEEREAVDASGGYWCHAGGLSPILKAGDWIGPHTTSADLGAGNGLQGLLLQTLYPHALTVQYEISAKMVEIGKRLQTWLSIPEDRIQWVSANLLEIAPREIDFLYLYRPLRPEGEGAEFYTRLASWLERSSRPVVVFSIADCLRSFLSERFEVFYGDGHLTCFRGPVCDG
jgi:hypothetical protein